MVSMPRSRDVSVAGYLCVTADDASHNLKLASIFAGTFPAPARQRTVENPRGGSFEMGFALQINFALWLMIVCAALEASRLVECLN